jgi:starch-binding outer membrane protein, SusD/RagB family
MRSPKPSAFASTCLLLIALAGPTTACNDLLNVDIPSQVVAQNLDDPTFATLLVHSAQTDFECAWGRYVLAQGIHGDEFADGQFSVGAYWGTDRRTTTDEANPLHTNSCDAGLQSEAFPGVYTPLQVARYQAEDVARRLDSWEGIAGRDTLKAKLRLYEGYSIVLLGESYCSLAIDVGPELTRATAFAEAEARFTDAINLAGTAAPAVRNAALVGRARARLNIAVANNQVVNATKLAEAGADAQQVPAGFVFNATFGDNVTRRYNSTFHSNNFSRYFTVEDDFRNVMHMGVRDPRVNVVNEGIAAFNGVTPLWTQRKYATRGASMPVARYAEAQLILAEAQGGQAAVDIINALHTAAGLPPYAGGTPDEIRQHIIAERSIELVFEGHHLGDKIRYNLPFTPAAGTPFPPHAGGVYGSTTCLPLPRAEKEANPNFSH